MLKILSFPHLLNLIGIQHGALLLIMTVRKFYNTIMYKMYNAIGWVIIV